MGKIEKEVSKKIRNTKIQKAILQTIAGVGVLSVAVLAPNVFQALKIFNLKGKELYNKKRSVNQSRLRLLKSHLIEYDKNGFLKLTERGLEKLEKIEMFDYRLNIPKKWDKKWRILIFDINEKRKGLREKIRNTLIKIGFVRLQDSVWVFPYDCEDLITLLKADFKIGKDLLYIVADKIENDNSIKKLFGLD